MLVLGLHDMKKKYTCLEYHDVIVIIYENNTGSFKFKTIKYRVGYS